MCADRKNSKISTLVIALFLLCAVAPQAFSQTKPKSFQLESKQQRDARMAWWRQARFGMFIHWGLYAIPAGRWKGEQIPGASEWIMNSAHIPVAEYEQLAGQFNPIKFDADQWVQTAKDAGMKYIVITSKHHDGFCLWDSKVSRYDVIDATPFKRDILKELSDACRKHDIKLCFYHSIMDWHHPDAQAPHYPTYNTDQKKNPNFPRYVENYLKPQIRELITNYGPLGVLWFDGEWIPEWTEDDGRDMYRFVKSLQPDIIINNRVGKGRKGMEGLTEEDSFAGDFDTPEQQIPPTGLPGIDWESCMTINDTWGFKKDDPNWKSARQLIHNLVDIVSKGGNYLLNVGPTAEGLIPQPSTERLQAIGAWLQVNGESIYGTTANPVGELSWGRCTAKSDRLYLHVFNWPKDGRLVTPPLGKKVEKACLLIDKTRGLGLTQDSEGNVTISLPAEAPDEIDTVVVLELENSSKKKV